MPAAPEQRGCFTSARRKGRMADREHVRKDPVQTTRSDPAGDGGGGQAELAQLTAMDDAPLSPRQSPDPLIRRPDRLSLTPHARSLRRCAHPEPQPTCAQSWPRTDPRCPDVGNRTTCAQRPHRLLILWGSVPRFALTTPACTTRRRVLAIARHRYGSHTAFDLIDRLRDQTVYVGARWMDDRPHPSIASMECVAGASPHYGGGGPPRPLSLSPPASAG